jgi:hypothetical protein
VTSGAGRSRQSERWWDGFAGAPPTGQGGFGTSRFFPRPGYQAPHTTATMRSVPDVVADSDPASGVVICQASGGGCPTGALYGGTSFAAPVWAAFTALVNQSLGRNIGNANQALYPLAGTPAFRDAAALGTDFAHVGLGSPSVDQITRLLAGQATGTPDAGSSIVTPVVHVGLLNGFNLPLAVPADGSTPGYVVVKLRDGNGHLVPGKTVSLAANAGSSAVITPPSGVTDADGSVLFTVTNLAAEDVTVTATDTSDGLALATKPKLAFAVPRAAAGGITASLSPVTADGVAFSTITVTLRDTLNRPTPGKLVTLDQGGGRSIVTAPNPAVTDANGQIAFEVRNTANETVTYTAVDVTDDELPVPGSAAVTFQNGAGVTCGPATAPQGLNGYTLTPFVTGFVARDFLYGNVNWGGCPGISSAAFAGDGIYVGGFVDGDFHEVPLNGGAATTATKLSTLGPTLSWPVFGKSGRLYAVRANTGTGAFSGKVIELDPVTGAEVRTLASNLPCAAGLAVDPLSGDLFFDNSCFGGPEDRLVRRIRNPDAASPTVETYATLPLPANGLLSFAPNGTLYAASGYNGARLVVRITGTNTTTPGAVTTIAGVNALFWLTVAETLPNGDAKSLVVLDGDQVSLVDLTTTPPTKTAIVSPGLGSGTIGPDGCLYPIAAGTMYRLTDPNGGCSFAATTANPAITLTPARVAPDPARGTPHTVTAQLRNLGNPANTPVFFEVNGANPRVQMIRADASGQATFTYVGAQEGRDAIVARVTTDGGTVSSNRARVTWGPGKRTTDVSLNLTPVQGAPGVPVDVVATVVAVGPSSNEPVAGVTVVFTLGSARCTAVTDAAGRATCPLTPTAAGLAELTVAFEGTADLLPAGDAVGFRVVGPEILRSVGAFTLYTARAAKGGPRFERFGPVTLAGAQTSTAYDVVGPIGLATPSATGGGATGDPATHLSAYAVTVARGTPKPPKRTIRAVDQCSDAQLAVSKPSHLFVPSGVNPGAPASPPAAPSVDHYLCSRVRGPKPSTGGAGLRKGAQVDVTDQFQTRRYDLRRARLLCLPVAKSGTPVLAKGPGKGQPFPITPATVGSPQTGLVCYDARPARRRIEQAGCAPTTASDKGTRIKPAQPRDKARSGLYVANQFGTSQRMDTRKATTVCLPARL